MSDFVVGDSCEPIAMADMITELLLDELSADPACGSVSSFSAAELDTACMTNEACLAGFARERDLDVLILDHLCVQAGQMDMAILLFEPEAGRAMARVDARHDGRYRTLQGFFSALSDAFFRGGSFDEPDGYTAQITRGSPEPNPPWELSAPTLATAPESPAPDTAAADIADSEPPPEGVTNGGTASTDETHTEDQGDEEEWDVSWGDDAQTGREEPAQPEPPPDPEEREIAADSTEQLTEDAHHMGAAEVPGEESSPAPMKRPARRSSLALQATAGAARYHLDLVGYEVDLLIRAADRLDLQLGGGAWYGRVYQQLADRPSTFVLPEANFGLGIHPKRVGRVEPRLTLQGLALLYQLDSRSRKVSISGGARAVGQLGFRLGGSLTFVLRGSAGYLYANDPLRVLDGDLPAWAPMLIGQAGLSLHR